MRSSLTVLAFSICVVGVAGCTPQPSPTSFSRSEAMTPQQVQFGQVTGVRNVEIRPGQTRLGMVTGATLGAIGGSQIGGDTASNVAAGVGGAVVGGAIGSAIQGSQTQRAIEVTVTLQETGQSIAIVQPGDIRDFRMGDQVRVVGSAENTRVVR
jgi:outer membrane lipoprotein SlyB